MAEKKGYNVAYIRVSTVEQNEDRQIEALKKYNIDKIFLEKVSGKNIKDRPKLNEMLNFVREGDTVYVHDFSRLARSTKDLLELLEFFDKNKVRLISNKENFDTSTPQGMLMVNLLAAINQFERANLLERQKEGIEIAKRKGKYKGGRPLKYNKKLFDQLYPLYMKREITATEFAKRLSISRPSIYKLIKEKANSTEDENTKVD